MQMREKMHSESGEAERRGVREGEGLAGCVCVTVKQRLPEDKLKTYIIQKEINGSEWAVRP